MFTRCMRQTPIRQLLRAGESQDQGEHREGADQQADHGVQQALGSETVVAERL